MSVFDVVALVFLVLVLAAPVPLGITVVVSVTGFYKHLGAWWRAESGSKPLPLDLDLVWKMPPKYYFTLFDEPYGNTEREADRLAARRNLTRGLKAFAGMVALFGAALLVFALFSLLPGSQIE